MSRVAARDLPEHRLAREPRQHRKTESGDLRHVLQQREVVLVGLAETEARIDHDALARDAGGHRRFRASGEIVAHLGDDVVVLRRLLHRLRLALLVHEAHRGVARRDRLQRARAFPAADVVDQARAGLDGFAHERGLAGVDRDRHAAVCQRFEHRQHAAALFVERHRCGARPGRFTADVEDVRTLVDQRSRMRDCSVARGVEAAVGEGVRGDVDDAHDERAIEREAVAAAVKNCARRQG